MVATVVFIWISLAPLPEALQDARKRSEEMLMPSGEIFVKNKIFASNIVLKMRMQNSLVGNKMVVHIMRLFSVKVFLKCKARCNVINWHSTLQFECLWVSGTVVEGRFDNCDNECSKPNPISFHVARYFLVKKNKEWM